MNFRSARASSRSKVPIPSEDWSGLLRKRQSATAIQTSSSPAKKRKLSGDVYTTAPEKAKGQAFQSFANGPGQTRSAPSAPLTENNLKLFDIENSQGTLATVPSVVSTTSTRAYAPSNPRFQEELVNAGFVIGGFELPAKGEVERIQKIMERQRGSPEPDRDSFHQIRVVVQEENEAGVVAQLSPLLMVHRNIPLNNHKTRNLLYRHDSQWTAIGSSRPGLLPTPKPGLCLSFMKSAFAPTELEQMTSPYIDNAGFAPFMIFEVKTALQGDQIANRQNANNVIAAITADYNLQEKVGRAGLLEGKIRVITGAHNTRNMWIDGWYWRFGSDGMPKWCKCFNRPRQL